MGLTKVNIFKFNDYREVLIALIGQRKKNRQAFSYRWFSQRAGLTSPNFLNLVVKGQRHLSPDSIEKVIEIFGLNKEEGDFFRNLVHFNKAKTLSEKEHFAALLVRSRKFQDEYPLSRDQFEYYSDWYNIPVREALNLKSPPQSDEEISQCLQPAISLSEARESLEKLLTLGLVEKVDHKYKPKQESVSTGHKFSSYGVVQYHKKMMTLATEALDRFPSAEREISSVTIGMSEETFSKIKKEIEDFRSRLMAIAEEDRDKERIYQMNFQLFPLSKQKGSTK
jgi:uncharacterized protein (TIGR02147 family)